MGLDVAANATESRCTKSKNVSNRKTKTEPVRGREWAIVEEKEKEKRGRGSKLGEPSGGGRL